MRNGASFSRGSKGNKQTYIVTAKHVVNGNPGESLLVFPNKNTDLSIPINAQITIDNPDSFDNYYSDIVIYRIDHDQLHIEPGSVMRTVDFSKYDPDWITRHRDSDYFMLGFPVEDRIVNYEEYLVSSTQHLLKGRYAGPNTSQYCHEIEFAALNGVTDLNGLSGSPVFCVSKNGGTPRAATFCGMSIHGGAAARRVVFVDAFVINAMLDKIGTPNPQLNRTREKPRAG